MKKILFAFLLAFAASNSSAFAQSTLTFTVGPDYRKSTLEEYTKDLGSFYDTKVAAIRNENFWKVSMDVYVDSESRSGAAVIANHVKSFVQSGKADWPLAYYQKVKQAVAPFNGKE